MIRSYLAGGFAARTLERRTRFVYGCQGARCTSRDFADRRLANRGGGSGSSKPWLRVNDEGRFKTGNDVTSGSGKRSRVFGRRRFARRHKTWGVKRTLCTSWPVKCALEDLLGGQPPLRCANKFNTACINPMKFPIVKKADEAFFNWCEMHGQVRAVRHFTCHTARAGLSESHVLLTGPPSFASYFDPAEVFPCYLTICSMSKRCLTLSSCLKKSISCCSLSALHFPYFDTSIAAR